MKFDLARLFEPRKPPKPLYPTIRAELDAIRSNKKKMSTFGVTPEHMMDPESYYFEILELAFERGLAVVLEAERTKRRSRKAVPHPSVYVARPEELWRVPAFLLTWQVGSSSAIEAQQSLLRGYTPAQWKRYLAQQQQRECEGINIYTLLSREQKARVVAHGRRCFGRPVDMEGMTFFVHRSGRPKANAASFVPKGLTLARTGVNGKSIDAMFPDWRNAGNIGLNTTRVSCDQARALTDGLVDGVQFLSARGWTW